VLVFPGSESEERRTTGPPNNVFGVNTGCLPATSDSKTGKTGSIPTGCGANPGSQGMAARDFDAHGLDATWGKVKAGP
jgi:hypothetical protein